MRVGFTMPNNGGVEDPHAVVEVAVLAERLGFDSVWVAHHVFNIGYVLDRLGDRPYYDALTILTFAAARTERVELGTSVLVLPYLQPAGLAKQLATIDRLSGAGWWSVSGWAACLRRTPPSASTTSDGDR